jgi:hypothetical protein
VTQVTNLAEAVDAWLGHYSANWQAAHARIAELKASGIPDESVAEWLGATLALTPAEHRCAHWVTSGTVCSAYLNSAASTTSRRRIAACQRRSRSSGPRFSAYRLPSNDVRLLLLLAVGERRYLPSYVAVVVGGGRPGPGP